MKRFGNYMLMAIGLAAALAALTLGGSFPGFASAMVNKSHLPDKTSLPAGSVYNELSRISKNKAASQQQHPSMGNYLL